jgi:hypothetical protein
MVAPLWWFGWWSVLFDSADIEVAERHRLIGQRRQALGEDGGLGEIRVGHGVLIGRELHDLDIGVGPIPVLGESPPLRRAPTGGLGSPLPDQRLDLIGSGVVISMIWTKAMATSLLGTPLSAMYCRSVDKTIGFRAAYVVFFQVTAT